MNSSRTSRWAARPGSIAAISIGIAIGLFSPRASAAGCSGIPSERPLNAWAQKIGGILAEKDFKQLDEIEIRSRDLKVRVEDGQTLRAAVFKGTGSSEDHSDPCGSPPNDAVRVERHEKMTALVKEWKKHSPNSPGPRLAEVTLVYDLAWAIRGTGYANTVPKEAWAKFRSAVDQANALLVSLPESDKRDPQWHGQRLEISHAQSASDEVFNKMYADAMLDANDYEPIHFVAVKRATKKWGGSPRLVAQVAGRTIGNPSSDGSHVLYARMQWGASTWDMFTNGQAEWPLMRAGFDQLLARYPHPWNLNNATWFACSARDMDTLVVLFARMKKESTPVNLVAWQGMLAYKQCKEGAEQWEAYKRASSAPRAGGVKSGPPQGNQSPTTSQPAPK